MVCRGPAGYALTAFIRAVPVAKARRALKAVLAETLSAGDGLGLALAAGQFGSWPVMDPVLPELTAALRAHPGPLLRTRRRRSTTTSIGTEPWQRIAHPEILEPRPSSCGSAPTRYMVLSFAGGGGGCGTRPRGQEHTGQLPHYADLRMLGDLLSYGGYQLLARIPYRTTAYSSDYMLWAARAASMTAETMPREGRHR